MKLSYDDLVEEALSQSRKALDIIQKLLIENETLRNKKFTRPTD